MPKLPHKRTCRVVSKRTTSLNGTRMTKQVCRLRTISQKSLCQYRYTQQIRSITNNKVTLCDPFQPWNDSTRQHKILRYDHQQRNSLQTRLLKISRTFGTSDNKLIGLQVAHNKSETTRIKIDQVQKNLDTRKSVQRTRYEFLRRNYVESVNRAANLIQWRLDRFLGQMETNTFRLSRPEQKTYYMMRKSIKT